MPNMRPTVKRALQRCSPQKRRVGTVPEISSIVGKTPYRKFRSVSEAGFEHHMATFRPERSDIILTTQPRTGTTWLQVICHVLRGGDTNFEDIYEVVPWHQLAFDIDQDVMDQKGFRPRLFKSHQTVSAEMQGCKYITTIRNPLATLRSFYHFTKVKGHPEIRDLTLDEFYANPAFFADAMLYWHGGWSYLREAFLLRNHPDVLVLVYEDMCKDLRSQLPSIARFLGVPLTTELESRVLEMTSKEAMLRDVSKYSDSWAAKRMAGVGRNKRPWLTSAKVIGNVYSEPSPELSQAIEHDFRQQFGSLSEGKILCYEDLQNCIRVAEQEHNNKS